VLVVGVFVLAQQQPAPEASFGTVLIVGLVALIIHPSCLP